MRCTPLTLIALTVIVALSTAACGGIRAVGLSAANPQPEAPTSSPASLSQESALLGQMGELRGEAEGLGELLSHPRPDGKDWRLLVIARAAEIVTGYQTVAGIPIPAGSVALQEAVLGVADDCRSVAKSAEAAVAGGNTAIMKKAGEEAAACAKMLDDLNGELQEAARSAPPSLSAKSLPPSATPVGAAPVVAWQATLTDDGLLRLGPGEDYPAETDLAKGTVVTVIGRSADGNWLVVSASGMPQAWIAASLLDDLLGNQRLPVVRSPR